MMETARINGFPEADLEGAIQMHAGRRYQAEGRLNFTCLKDGDQVSIGEFVFSCVETPGHTHGHLCLYEPKTRIFFSGDHILGDITPNISIWFDGGNPLQEYLESLEKINHFDIGQVFPGHRKSFTDCQKRIAELKHHHEIRANDILSILEKGSQRVYQVASQMTWEIDCKKWEDSPVPQKWFASEEARSHLHHLQAKNKVKKEMANGKIFFSLS